MAQFKKYPVPHLLGRVDYSGVHRFEPEGDTIHLFEPLLLIDGHAFKADNGKFKVWTTGSTKPMIIATKSKASPCLVIRFAGLDAPNEHYSSTGFTLRRSDGTTVQLTVDRSKPQEERCQPLWKPAIDFVVRTLQRAGWALVMLDRDVKDKDGRVLGYVYTSDSAGTKGRFLSLQLVSTGLAFPYLFESSGDLIPVFLEAAKKAKDAGKGVWGNFVDAPLAYRKTFPAPKRYTDDEPKKQAAAKLNLPVVFRRVVDAEQLLGLPLKEALRKYDAIDYETGDLVTGEFYQKIPIERRIWAPHLYN